MPPLLALLAFCLLAGHALAWRANYLALVPGSITAVLATASIGSMQGDGAGSIIVYSLLNVSAFQAGYLFAVLYPAGYRFSRLQMGLVDLLQKRPTV